MLHLSKNKIAGMYNALAMIPSMTYNSGHGIHEKYWYTAYKFCDAKYHAKEYF